MVRFDLASVVEYDAHSPPGVNPDLAHPVAELEVSTERLEVPRERLEDLADSRQRSRETLLEDRFEHDAELAEVHVARLGTAVEHQRAEQHIHEHGVGKEVTDDAPRRDRLLREIEFIEFPNVPDQSVKPVRLVRKLARHLIAEQLEIVVESESSSGELDGRSALGAEVEVIPAEAKLLEQLGERPFPRTGRGVVGDSVQADVVVAAAQAVEGIQAADRRVPLENADRLFVVGQTNPGGQARHPRADDQGVVAHAIRSGTAFFGGRFARRRARGVRPRRGRDGETNRPPATPTI